MLLLLMQLFTKEYDVSSVAQSHNERCFFKTIVIHCLPIGCLLIAGALGPGVDRESCLVVVVGADKYSVR